MFGLLMSAPVFSLFIFATLFNSCLIYSRQKIKFTFPSQYQSIFCGLFADHFMQFGRFGKIGRKPFLKTINYIVFQPPNFYLNIIFLAFEEQHQLCFVL